MKDFAKSIVCNTKAEAEKVGNFEDPKKAKYYIEMWERRRDDAKRSLQNAEGHLKEAMKHRYGDKEFNQREVQRYQEAVKAAEASIKQYDDLIKSAAKTSFGNTRTGNSYNWEERRGHQELYDPTVPFGGHVRGYVEKTKNGYTGAKTNGSILISKKEFATEDEAQKFFKQKTGNEAITYTPEQLKRASWTTWQYIISHPEKYDDKTIAEAKRLNAQKTGNKLQKIKLIKSNGQEKAGEFYIDTEKGETFYYEKKGGTMDLLNPGWVSLFKIVNNSKTGNETLGQFITQKPKAVNEDKTGAEEFFKKLSDDVKEREEKDDADIEKVGNSLIGKTVWVKKSDGHQYKATVLREDGGRVYVNTGDGDQFWRLKHEVEVINKVGNFKTGTSQLKPGDKVMSFGKKGTVKEVIGENTDNIYGEPLIKVEFEDGTTKTIGEHYMRKVGNKNLDWNVGNIDWDVANFNGKWYITKNGQKLKGPFSSMQEAERYLDGHKWELQDKYGNTKTGNSKWELPDGSTATVEDDGTIKIKKPRDSSIYITKLWDKERAEKQLAQKGAKKVGNSASDDKFAYVMREFDEGKLKTPDGKVVTDPAQAKAIAYSESKKTENGLARARNAMNKKCGNSQVTLWKGNDSVLISEDGTVQYLESNSFETDRDKYGSMQEAIDDLTKKGYRKK